MSTSSESQLVLSVTPTLSLAPSRPPDARLSTSPLIRIPAVTLLAGVVGAALGVSHGSTMAGLRFRAENTHRLPDSQVGWYLYHKSKNYHMMLGGIKEGLKMSAKVGFWAGSFFLVEEAVDQARGEGGKKDFLSSTVAGMGVAGGFSLWSRFCAWRREVQGANYEARSVQHGDCSTNVEDGSDLWPRLWPYSGCSHPHERAAAGLC